MLRKIFLTCIACLVACCLWADNIELNNDDNGSNDQVGRTEIPVSVECDDNEITVSSSDDIGITDVVIRNTANEVICHRVMDLSLGSVENIVLTEQQNAEKYVIELNTPDTNLYGFF